MLFVILPFYLVLLVSGVVGGFLLVLVVLLLRMSGFGFILFLFWLKFLPFLSTLHWPVASDDLGVGSVSFVELLILYELWAGERLSLEKLFLSVGGLGVQFQCRLFLLVQALIFGVPVGFLEPLSVPFLFCLVVLVGFFLGGLVLIIVVLGTLVGENVVMVLLPGLVRLLLFGFWMSFSFFLGILLPLVLVCLLGLFLLDFSLRVLLVGSPLGVCPKVVVFLVFLPLGDWFGVALVLCLLRWVVLVFTWVVVLVEALKESDYTEKHQHTLLDRVFQGSSLVPEFGKGLGFLWVQILVFLVPSF